MRKFKVISYIILFIVLAILALTVYTNATQNDEKNSKEKVIAEIKYLDLKLVDFFNYMNNIEIRNYKIYTTKVENLDSKQGEGEKNENNSSSTPDESSDTLKKSESSDSSKQSEEKSSSIEENSENEKQNEEDKYEMKESGILVSDINSINWEKCKNELELIYTSLSTITLDLYSLNIPQEDVLNFNKEIDNLTVSIEAENKELTLVTLVKIYEYISKFTQRIFDDNLYKSVVETKLNVFRAYSILDKKDWEKIKSNLTDAVNIYSSLLTNMGIETNKQASINRGYVILNELKNSVDKQNDSVFLIKYKNLLEEFNNI